jgi:hypothetical protein
MWDFLAKIFMFLHLGVVMVSWSVLLGGGAVVVLVGWILRQMLGGRHREVVEDSQATAPGLWMLIQGDSGPEFVPCSRDGDHHGFVVRGAFYPREFCRQVRNGAGIYMLASHCLMPSDGNSAHGGDYGNLVEVEQSHFTASWMDFDLARRRLNWSSIFNRGDGTMAGLRNIASGLMVVCLLFLLFQTFSIRSNIGRLADTNVTLTGQLARMGGGVAPAAPVSRSPDLGAPTGDK